MKKKYYISIISLLLLIYSCSTSNSDIEGLWVSTYHIENEQNKGVLHNTIIINIEGDSLKYLGTGEPKNGIVNLDLKTTFTRTFNTIESKDKIFGKPFKLFLHEISEDSIVISYESRNSVKEVYRKLEPTTSKLNWNPSNQSYEWLGNTSRVFTDFMENGLFVNYIKETENIYVGHWNIKKIQNSSFLVMDHLYADWIVIDSVKESSIYTSIFSKEKYNYVFKTKPPKLSSGLIGKWTLTDSEYINEVQPPIHFYPDNYEIPKIESLNISLDSIKITMNDFNFNQKWTFGGNDNLIIFPDKAFRKDTLRMETLSSKERAVRNGIMKIESLTETELILLVDYEKHEMKGFEQKLIFRRKKTTANNGYN